MKTLTLEEIKELNPCWLETAEGREKFRRIGSRKERWTAVDVLGLPKEEVSSEDKLWLVLREEFLGARTLHLFACEVAEQALGRIEKPDPRSIEAIRVKRLWIDGKATNQELTEARAAARAAANDAARGEARVAAWVAARDAAWAVAAAAAAWDAAWAAVWAAAWTAEDSVNNVAEAAAWDEQVQILRKMIEKEKEYE